MSLLLVPRFRLLVESNSEYATYYDVNDRRTCRTPVLVRHDDGERVYDLDDTDWTALLSEYNAGRTLMSIGHNFLSWLDDHTISGQYASDYISSCDECSSLNEPDSMVWVERTEEMICDSCRDKHYSTCPGCGRVTRDDEMVGTLHDESVCESCRDNDYGYCESCDGYYHFDLSYDHDHGANCDCEAPTMQFEMPNGQAGDEVRTITLPDGIISESALGQIQILIQRSGPSYPNSLYVLGDDGAYVRDENGAATMTDEYHAYHKFQQVVNNCVNAIGDAWKTDKGTFPKRLRAWAHREHKITLDVKLLEEIGNIARANSNGASVNVAFTRNLNMDASEFYHEGSCWWSEYGASRCVLKTNGGIGMRTFENVERPEYAYQTGPWAGGFGRHYVPTGRTITTHDVSGRAWVMPVKADDNGSLRPTTNTTDPDGWIVFNGYGDLDNTTQAQILANVTGMGYKRIGFDDDTMYINAGGYLVSTPDVLARVENVRWYLDQHSNLYNNESKVLAHV